MTHEVFVSDATIKDLLDRLAEAEETLRAIKCGEVDGLLITTPQGERVFTLKGAEHPYRMMVEAMEEGAVTLGADGAILYCNRRFTTLLRLPAERVLGATFTDFLTPESRRRFRTLAKASRRSSARGEVELLAPGGARVPVSLACSPLPEGEVEGLCLVVSDLTARKEADATIQRQNEELERRVRERTAELEAANEALRAEIAERQLLEAERERLLEEVERRAAELDATIESIADGMIIYDLDGKVVRFNAAADQIMHYQPEEHGLAIPERLAVLGVTKPDGTRFLPEETPAYRALRGEASVNTVMVLHRPHGTIWTSVSAAPIFSQDAICGAVVTFTDITAVHALQERMKTFVHMVSHDMRAPLTTILGHVGLLGRARELSNELPDISIDTIKRSVRRMDAMLQDLAAVARLESNQLEVDAQPLDLPRQLPEYVRRSGVAPATGRICLDLPAALPPVLADDDLLERVVTNLLSNAQKYSAPDTPIRLRAWQAGDEVTVSIIDQGQGIAPDDLPHLFERFYRARPTQRKAEGLGLGLYISRMLVEAHGGRIWADSAPGQRSTFSFTLPVVKADRRD